MDQILDLLAWAYLITGIVVLVGMVCLFAYLTHWPDPERERRKWNRHIQGEAVAAAARRSIIGIVLVYLLIHVMAFLYL